MSKDFGIRVASLVKRYGEVTAVDGVSFEVERGTTAALLGANGAGKTTTIAIILGLLIPTSGTVEVLGEDILSNRYRVLPRMNFSSPYVDLPRRLTVFENLDVYARLYGVRPARTRIEQLAEELDIATLLKRDTGTLSAGQRTRVALAKALLNEPDVLLLDEPTASLDPDTGDWIRTYIERYQDRHNATILLASHNMGEVERLCRDVIMMRAGQIVDQGAPRTLLDKYGRTNLEEVFLDMVRQPGSAPKGAPDRADAGGRAT